MVMMLNFTCVTDRLIINGGHNGAMLVFFDTYSANPPPESNGVGTTSQNLTRYFFLVCIFFTRSFQIQLAICEYFHLISIPAVQHIQ